MTTKAREQGAGLRSPSRRRSSALGTYALTLCWLAVTAFFAPVVVGQQIQASVQDNRFFCPVYVNGRGPFQFLLDTGSSTTTIEESLRSTIDLLSVGNGLGQGAGEAKVPYQTYHLSALTVAGIDIGPIDAPSFDHTELSSVVGFEAFDGVLGAELFRTQVVTFDPVLEEVTLSSQRAFRPGKDAVRIPFELDANDAPIVDAEVDGIAGRFLVDTGDRSGLTLYSPFWRSNDLQTALAPTVEAQTGFGTGGPIRSYVGRPHTFVMQGIPFEPPITRMSLQKGGAMTSSTLAGSIGMGYLTRYRFSIDYGSRSLWLEERNKRHRDEYDRSGTWLGFSPDNLRVISLVKNGPAEQAGLLVDDEVLAVGLLEASHRTLPNIRTLLTSEQIADIAFKVRRVGRDVEVTVHLRNLIAPPLHPRIPE